MLKKLGKITIGTREKTSANAKAPPGQFLTEKFPVLTYGPTPKIDTKEWRFRVFGLVEEELELDWKEFLALPQVTLAADFHCVTQWSRLDNTWQGIPFSEVMKRIKPKPEGKFVMVHCYGGYTTNLELEALLEEDVLFAHTHDGKLLPADHGGPLRLVVPKLYGWKSAKWVNGLEFIEHNEAGFWEMRGYNMHGDPWKEERFWDGLVQF